MDAMNVIVKTNDGKKSMSSSYSYWSMFQKEIAKTIKKHGSGYKRKNTECLWESRFVYQATLMFHQAIYEYSATKSDELNIQSGDYLCGLKTDNPDWWIMYNMNTQQIGWAPVVFTKSIQVVEHTCDFEYEKQNDDELTMKEKDVVLVIQENIGVDGWCKGFLMNDMGTVELLVQDTGMKYTMYQVGLVPSNFLSLKSSSIEKSPTFKSKKQSEKKSSALESKVPTLKKLSLTPVEKAATVKKIINMPLQEYSPSTKTASPKNVETATLIGVEQEEKGVQTIDNEVTSLDDLKIYVDQQLTKLKIELFVAMSTQ